MDIFYSPDIYNIQVTFKGGKQYGIGEDIFYDSLTTLNEITEIPTILDYPLNYWVNICEMEDLEHERNNT